MKLTLTTTTGGGLLQRRALPSLASRIPLTTTRTSLLHRLINTSSTAYPSGSVKNPTQIISSTASPESVSRSEKSRTVPESHRELPDLPSRTPLYVGSFLVIASVWAGFIYFSTNAEKANSSIVKAVLFELRSNPSVLAALGQSIKPEKDDMFGQLWVDGQINLMQGSVDVAFRVTGSERSGKVYFTSVRRERGSEFEIIRWKLIRDDGVIVDLVNEGAQARPVLLTSTDNNSVAIGTFPSSQLASGVAPSRSIGTPATRLV